MAEKDIALKALLSKPDVFADVVSNFLYHQPGIVKGEHLILAEKESKVHFPEDDSIHGQARDVAMYDRGHGAVYCLYGIENEVSPKYYEVFRCMSYDGAAYYEQVNKARKDSNFRYYPVITLVLNYNKYPWTQPFTIYEALGIRKGSLLEDIVSNYHMNVVNVGYQSRDLRDGLESDFRAVCAALTQLYGFEDIPEDEFKSWNYLHRDELKDVLSAFTEDGLIENLTTTSEGGRIMYQDLGEVWRQEGLALGKKEGAQEIINHLIKMYGLNSKQVHDLLDGKGLPATGSSMRKDSDKLNKLSFGSK